MSDVGILHPATIFKIGKPVVDFSVFEELRFDKKRQCKTSEGICSRKDPDLPPPSISGGGGKLVFSLK